ncbi:MAG: signal recognition particle protein Srp19, partial [Candidatus Bathyarchaeota archaeon]|nr:signal recognition particle protein Srp19 [Candidatus Bathyarchaeota archaeon]
QKDINSILSGKFTLSDMYHQFEAMRSMGPLQKVLSMVPGFSYKLPEAQLEMAEERMDRWKYIIDSMTPGERETPKILNASRVRRIAQGSGTTEKEVRELIKQYNAVRKMFRQLKGRRRMLNRLPFKFG